MRDSTREHWRKVDELFEAALDLPAEERLDFLGQACGGDPALLDEVRSLIEIEAEAERVLGDSAEYFAQPVLSVIESQAAAVAEPVPEMIGPYRIISEIGSGGMGRVFLAERDDRFFKRTVALKLVRHGVAVGPIVERFRSEQRILARLEHPAIARLYDAGLSDEGWPYLAMEYVRGRRIDEYCDQHRLTDKARIRLFIDVCRAVQYAHRNLIVHRDLKPSNIAVTDDGEVKLLDFGIAKLLEDPSDDSAEVLTRTGGIRAMTLEYAAPEQVQGGAVTTATDVYSLGVVLYELLTGRRPIDLRGKSAWEAQRLVAEAEPRKPSTAVQRRPTRSPRNDSSGRSVETSSAGSVPDDAPLGPIPDDETPGAAPDGAASGYAADEAAAMDSAVEAASSVPDVADPDIFQISRDRSTTPERLRRRLRGELDTILLTALQKDPARRYATVDAFHDDLEAFLAGAPVQAQPATPLYRVRTFVRRHRWGVSVCATFLLLLGAFAVSTRIQLAATSAQRDETTRALEKSESVMAFMTDLFREADPLVAQGDTLNVYQLLERATRRAEMDLIEQPDLLAAILQTIGAVYLNLAEYDTAVDMLDRALTLHRSGMADAGGEAATMELLARAFRERGDFAEAVAMNEDALALQRRIHPANHASIAASLSELGISLHRSGDLERAEAVYNEAIAAYRAAEGGHPGLADALQNLGVLRHDVGHVADAEPILREALDLAERHYGVRHPKVGLTLSSLASALQYAGNLPAAESLFTRALDIHRTAFGDVHPNVSIVLNNLATLQDEQGNHEEAESLYRLAIRTDSLLLGAVNPDVAISRHNYGLMLLEEERPEDAEVQIREAVNILRATLTEEHLYTAILSGSLGLVVCENGRYDEGERILRGSIVGMQEQLPPDHWRLAVANRNLGACLLGRGAWDEAEELLRASHARLVEERGATSDAARSAADWLAELAARRVAEGTPAQ